MDFIFSWEFSIGFLSGSSVIGVISLVYIKNITKNSKIIKQKSRDGDNTATIN